VLQPLLRRWWFATQRIVKAPRSASRLPSLYAGALSALDAAAVTPPFALQR
jgi:hypothetical protein